MSPQVGDMSPQEFIEWADALFTEHPLRTGPPWQHARVHVWMHPETEQEIVYGLTEELEDGDRRVLIPHGEKARYGLRTRWGEVFFRTDPYRIEPGELRLQVIPEAVHQLEWAPVSPAPPPYSIQTAPPEHSSGHRFETPYVCKEDGYRRTWLLFGEMAARSWLWQKPELRRQFLDRHEEASLRGRASLDDRVPARP